MLYCTNNKNCIPVFSTKFSINPNPYPLLNPTRICYETKSFSIDFMKFSFKINHIKKAEQHKTIPPLKAPTETHTPTETH